MTLDHEAEANSDTNELLFYYFCSSFSITGV